eukprot:Lankesteria_metandrocarpae@DN5385_c0_g1_i4.p1
MRTQAEWENLCPNTVSEVAQKTPKLGLVASLFSLCSSSAAADVLADEALPDALSPSRHAPALKQAAEAARLLQTARSKSNVGQKQKLECLRPRNSIPNSNRFSKRKCPPDLSSTSFANCSTRGANICNGKLLDVSKPQVAARQCKSLAGVLSGAMVTDKSIPGKLNFASPPRPTAGFDKRHLCGNNGSGLSVVFKMTTEGTAAVTGAMTAIGSSPPHEYTCGTSVNTVSHHHCAVRSARLTQCHAPSKDPDSLPTRLLGMHSISGAAATPITTDQCVEGTEICLDQKLCLKFHTIQDSWPTL